MDDTEVVPPENETGRFLRPLEGRALSRPFLWEFCKKSGCAWGPTNPGSWGAWGSQYFGGVGRPDNPFHVDGPRQVAAGCSQGSWVVEVLLQVWAEVFGIARAGIDPVNPEANRFCPIAADPGVAGTIGVVIGGAEVFRFP